MTDATPTVESLTEELAAANARLDAADANLAAATSQRDLLLKQRHAHQTMLAAHNVPTDLDGKLLGNLHVKGGVVSGDYLYSPPRPQTPARQETKTQPATAGNLTLEAVEQMTPEQIDKNWSDIKSLLRGA